MRSPHTLYLWLVRLLGVAALVLAYSLVFGPYGLAGLQSKRSGIAERSGRIFERVQVNQDLEKRLEALQSDPRALDEELRSSQSWVRPGEVMIILPTEGEETKPH